MNKLPKTLLAAVLVLAFVILAGLIAGILTGMISMKTGMYGILFVGITAWLILYLAGAKNSALGGRFKRNYPDSNS